jgi:hypothetical protein
MTTEPEVPPGDRGLELPLAVALALAGLVALLLAGLLGAELLELELLLEHAVTAARATAAIAASPAVAAVLFCISFPFERVFAFHGYHARATFG